MGLYSCQLPGFLKKTIKGSDKTKHVKKYGEIFSNNYLKKKTFGSLPKIGDWIQNYVEICHGF